MTRSRKRQLRYTQCKGTDWSDSPRGSSVWDAANSVERDHRVGIGGAAVAGSMNCSHKAFRSFGLALATIACLVGLLAQPAAAQSDGDDDGARVVITGRVDVGAQERTDSVVIFDGPAVIDGTVSGSVVAFNGDVLVRGNVDDNVVALKGRATIEDGATVGGDVVSSERPVVASGARVDGDIRRVNVGNFFSSFGWLLWLGWWLAVGVSMFVLGVLLLALFPRIFPPILEAGRTRVGPAIGWGLAVAIGLPIVFGLLLITLIGLPLGLVGLLSLALLYALGYVVAALLLGRRIVSEPRSVYLAFFVGLVILRIVGILPVLGGLVSAAATVYGVGALTIAAWRAARTPTPPSIEPVAATPTTPRATDV